MVCRQIPISKNYTGIVIGPGGQSAAHVRKAARVQLHVRRNIQDGGIQVVELKGTQAQVSGAGGRRVGVERCWLLIV